MERLALGLVWFPVFLFSTTLHEAAHAWAAKLGGDRTAYDGGQVSLDPMPHIKREPFGMVLVPILSFFFSGWMLGWASTPYNAAWADRHPKRAAWMSLAGPGANLLLVLLAAAGIWAGIGLGVFYPPEALSFTSLVGTIDGTEWKLLGSVVSITFSLNLLLMVFNLLPLPPLDGAGALPLFLPQKTLHSVQQWLRNPTYQMVGLVIAWQLFDRIFAPVFSLAITILYPGIGYH